MATILEELKARGLVHALTNEEGLAQLLAAGPVTLYAGFDPSGISLHAGSLVPLSVMRHMTAAGHRTIGVIGGATGMVGDPSGKSEERKLLDQATLDRNVAAVTAQVRRLVPAATAVDNADWTRGVGYLEFLRDVGKHVTVNYMLAKDSVKTRLDEREQGISYTEFSYMLLQAFDFWKLWESHGCRLQIGGSDQWGNITCGIELTRKLGGPELFGMTSPLLMTAAGTKFGKTEGGTSVWLDAAITSPYRFYQYWINAEDADVEKYLKMFSSLSLADIASVMAEHDVERGKRIAQKRLAADVTAWVHGKGAADSAQRASDQIFGGFAGIDKLPPAELETLYGEVPTTSVSRSELAAGLNLIDLLVNTKLSESKGAARRLQSQGGVYVNGARVDDANRAVGAADVYPNGVVVLRAGKKSFHLLRVTA